MKVAGSTVTLTITTVTVLPLLLLSFHPTPAVFSLWIHFWALPFSWTLHPLLLDQSRIRPCWPFPSSCAISLTDTAWVLLGLNYFYRRDDSKPSCFCSPSSVAGLSWWHLVAVSGQAGTGILGWQGSFSNALVHWFLGHLFLTAGGKVPSGLNLSVVIVGLLFTMRTSPAHSLHLGVWVTQGDLVNEHPGVSPTLPPQPRINLATRDVSPAVLHLLRGSPHPNFDPSSSLAGHYWWLSKCEVMTISECEDSILTCKLSEGCLMDVRG